MAIQPMTVILALFLLTISFGLGSTLKPSDFENAKKKPKAFGIGMVCQFILMPLLATVCVWIFDFDYTVAVGVILVGSAPGGSSSNLFTYWCGGNVALSITMSCVSTVAAIGMIPFSLFFYAGVLQGVEDPTDIAMDYTSLFLGLAIVVGPAAGGMYWRPRGGSKKTEAGLPYHKVVEKIASVSGVFFLVLALGYGIITEYQIFKSSWQLYFVAAAMEPVGCFLGYQLAKSQKLAMKDCRAVALESGVQNSSLIIAIIYLSTDAGPLQSQLLLFPYLYSLFYCINSGWIAYYLRYLAIQNGEDVDVDEEAEAEAAALELQGVTPSDKPDALPDYAQSQDAAETHLHIKVEN
jgi:BASS family bile acid:Na+ symporter